MLTCNCKLRRCLLADTSDNHIAQSRFTFVTHLVQISYSFTVLAIIHKYQEYQERYSLYTTCLYANLDYLMSFKQQRFIAGFYANKPSIKSLFERSFKSTENFRGTKTMTNTKSLLKKVFYGY